jgi:hyperosmotically inducible periplasmic protein
MVRSLIRVMLVLLVLVAGAFYLFGYWSGGSLGTAPGATETKAPPQIDTAKARAAGAEIGEKAAVAATRVGQSLEEGSLTAKIKAKMVLDDLVKARAISVSTEGTTVTLTGSVQSQKEHDRALALARETDGVTRVVDRVDVR